MQYERIMAAVAATPWAIEPHKGGEIAAFLSLKARGGDVPPAAVAAMAAGRARRPKGGPQPRGVALVPLYGVMTQRATLMTEVSSLLSAEDVGRALDVAAADPELEAIVLDVDSPGGSVFGTAELGAKVAAAARVKPVIAVANSTAASGAYWVASQASELVVTPSGAVGSVGVYMMHVDQSEALRAAGQRVTLVAAGERKGSRLDHAPLGAEGRAEMQEQVAGYYDQFVRAVAAGRKTTPAAVRDGFGRGGMVLAADAVARGMADRVGTLDDVLARYGQSLSGVPPLGTGRAGPARAALPAAGRPLNLAVEIRRRRLLMGG